jgi:hypothetical protein
MLVDRVVTPIQQQASRALHWTKREIILAFFAAFVAGMGAGAAEAFISWALR